MNVARQHVQALAMLYGPDAGELRAIVREGLAEALRQADAMQSDEGLDQLLAQLHGIARTSGRLRGQLAQGVPHAPAA